jgi:hypothetical protein
MAAAELDCCPTSETPLQRHKMSTFWTKRYVFAIMIVSAFSMRYWLLTEKFYLYSLYIQYEKCSKPAL